MNMNLNDEEFLKALHDAFEKAITEVGLENFKKCSFFGSNDPAYIAAKKSRTDWIIDTSN